MIIVTPNLFLITQLQQNIMLLLHLYIRDTNDHVIVIADVHWLGTWIDHV